MKKTKLIPFDLELAKQGVKVIYVPKPELETKFLEEGDFEDLVWVSIKEKGRWTSYPWDISYLNLEVEVKTEKVYFAIQKNDTLIPDCYFGTGFFTSKEELHKRVLDETLYTFHEIEREIE